MIEEQRALAGGGERLALLQPALQRGARLRAHRHDAGLVALAEHAHGAVGEIHVAQIEAHQLGEPQSGGIQQLHHRQVAHLQWALRAHGQQRTHLVDVERMRQAPARLGRAHAGGRVVPEPSLAHQEGKKSAQRRQPALHAARLEAGCVAAGGKAQHLRIVDARPVADALAPAPLRQCLQFAQVGGDGVRRQAPLAGEVPLETLGPARFSSHARRPVWCQGRAANP